MDSDTNLVPEPAERRLISVVMPVYNEEANVETAYHEINAVFAGLGRYDHEFVFTDNHSEDGTFGKLSALAETDSRVRVIRFNRNYGFQRSLLTGYQFARGDAAIQIDCDLQDPPALIKEFIALWEKGHDVVVGIRRHRKESPLLTSFRRAFYLIHNAIADDRITRDAGDFRLLDRSVIDHLRALHDQNPYVRGLVASFASREAGIVYDRDKRSAGSSKFPFRKLVGFAMDGIIAHSTLPLRLATYVGMATSVVTFLVALAYIVASTMFGASWPGGFTTTTVLLLFGISINAIFLGIIGEYIARIYQQVRQRPLVVVERTINLPKQGEAR